MFKSSCKRKPLNMNSPKKYTLHKGYDTNKIKTAEEVKKKMGEVCWPMKNQQLESEEINCCSFRQDTDHDCLIVHLAQLKIKNCQEYTIYCEQDSVMNTNHLLTCVELHWNKKINWRLYSEMAEARWSDSPQVSLKKQYLEKSVNLVDSSLIS